LIILGIDPGAVSAAYGVIIDGVPSVVDDVPTVDRMVNATEWAEIVRGIAPDIAIIEQVGPMPKQGASSGFRFGMGVGLLRGVLAAQQVPLIQTAATKWKKHFRLDSDKEKSRALAIRMFPTMGRSLVLKKHHGRAEALLLAEYLWETNV
jgi:Holliday junction resolvasome RuvABC endonuclease subunit